MFGGNSFRKVKYFDFPLFEKFVLNLTLIWPISIREKIAQWMETSLDDATDPWGVKVERVEM